MFDHLDDPDPTPPDPARRQTVHERVARTRRMRRTTWGASATAVLLVGLGIAGLVVGRSDDQRENVSTATSDVPTTTSSEASTSTVVPPGTAAPPTTPPATAASALSSFLDRAGLADKKLSEAADRITAATTATDYVYDQRTVDLLTSTAPGTLTPMPAGMPQDLERATLLVYSDLVSRWASMSCISSVGTFPRSEYDGMDCFVHGGPAAARFPTDLAALQVLAAATPAFPPPDPRSHAGEETAARVKYIDESNLGCGGVGGFIAIDHIPVVWKTSPSGDPQGAPWQGTVGDGYGVPFRGSYDPAHGWTIEYGAC